MYDTYKLFQPLVSSELSQFSLNELAMMYQQNEATSIFATAYSKIFKLALLVSEKYYGLNNADKVSFCLEKLHLCLKTFNGENEFTTYFCTVYSNLLRTETQAMNCKKRKCILQSINDLINIGVEDTYNMIEMLLPPDLTEREFKLCMLEAMGYDRKDVAEELNVSRMTIHNMEKSLQNKLSHLQNY